MWDEGVSEELTDYDDESFTSICLIDFVSFCIPPKILSPPFGCFYVRSFINDEG